VLAVGKQDLLDAVEIAVVVVTDGDAVVVPPTQRQVVVRAAGVRVGLGQARTQAQGIDVGAAAMIPVSVTGKIVACFNWFLGVISIINCAIFIQTVFGDYGAKL
jgi:hypothetical protein